MIPENVGGVGMPMVAVVALIEEAGRVALPSPLLVTLQSSSVLKNCKTSSANALLEKIAQGSSVTLAVLDENGSQKSCNITVTKTRNGYKLNGTVYFVQDSAKADYFEEIHMSAQTHRSTFNILF